MSVLTAELNARKYRIMKFILKVLFAILLFSSIFGCSEQFFRKTDKHLTLPNKNLTGDANKISILEFQTDWDWIYKNPQPASLNNSEIDTIELILNRVVFENNIKQEELLKNHNKKYPNNKWTKTRFELDLKDKKRQYIAVINEHGEKEVWVNLFCDSFEGEDWKTELIFVEDGGNCYFNVKINLEKNTYSELMINGYA